MRFNFVQIYENYTDYDTALGNLEESDLSEGEKIDLADEDVRRLTFVGDNPRYAYLTLRNHEEKRITWEEGEQLLGHPVDKSLKEAQQRS